MSPTSRTKKWLRERGVLHDVAESYNVWAGTRKDLLGFIDLVALYPGNIVGIQVTGGGNLSARREKILGERSTQALAWLRSGGRILIHDWRKVTRGRRRVWDLREVELTLADFAARVLD